MLTNKWIDRKGKSPGFVEKIVDFFFYFGQKRIGRSTEKVRFLPKRVLPVFWSLRVEIHLVVLTYWSSRQVRVLSDGSNDNGHGAHDHGPGFFLGYVHRGTGLGNNRVEPVHRVRRVIDRAYRTVRFYQAVLTSHHVTGPLLRLVFDVTGGRIVNAILVRVAGWNLQNNNNYDHVVFGNWNTP